MHRTVTHVEHELLDRYRAHVDEPELRDMRVQFCLGDFDEAAWQTRLQRREKDRTKKHEIFLVLEMVVHACGDLFRQMILSTRNREAERNVAAIFDEILEVITQANDALRRVATDFSCSVPYFYAERQGPHPSTFGGGTPSTPMHRVIMISHGSEFPGSRAVSEP